MHLAGLQPRSLSGDFSLFFPDRTLATHHVLPSHFPRIISVATAVLICIAIAMAWDGTLVLAWKINRPNVGLMLDQRQRRWPSINLVLDPPDLFVGMIDFRPPTCMSTCLSICLSIRPSVRPSVLANPHTSAWHRDIWAALHRQTVVTVGFISEQLLLFVFVGQWVLLAVLAFAGNLVLHTCQRATVSLPQLSTTWSSRPQP